MDFSKITAAVIGLGLMGGSFAMRLKELGAEVRQVIFHKGECRFGRCAEYNNVRVFQVTDIDGIHYALPKGGLCRR